MSGQQLLRTANELRTANSLRTANKIRIAVAFIVIAAIIPRPAAAQGVMKGWVGVAYTTTGVGTSGPEGAFIFTDYPVIESIEPNSPAERAGLEAGDTIIAMNAQDLKNSPLPMASMVQPGKKIIFRFKRANAVREVTVTVAPRPRGIQPTFVVTMTDRTREPGAPAGIRERRMTPRDRASTEVAARVPSPPMAVLPPMVFGFGPRSIGIWGADLTGLNPGLRSLVGVNSPGIFVVNVALGTPAKESGLEPADVIVKADGASVGDPGELIRVLRESNGSSIRLQIVRRKKAQTITLRW